MNRCIFTDLPITNYDPSKSYIAYNINVNSNNHFIRLHSDSINWQNDYFFKKNKYIFHSLLANNKWFDDERNFINLADLENLILIGDYPKTHIQKLEYLFLYLINLQDEDGQKVKVGQILWNQGKWRELFFKSKNECNFYMNHLAAEGFIDLDKAIYPGLHMGAYEYSITYKGLSYSIKLQEEGDKSKKCFVAMSFNPSVFSIREAIKRAIIETGYEVILIDEQNIESERTINDEIIANLKRCKFCIADFTLHSNGVYFESGFALGQGKKVIYTCRKDEFENAHFDIRPLQHIIYQDPDELTKSLINKIKAFID